MIAAALLTGQQEQQAEKIKLLVNTNKKLNNAMKETISKVQGFRNQLVEDCSSRGRLLAEANEKAKKLD